MKILIFDSSSLINLTMNGLLGTLKELKQKFNGKFIIPESVKNEVVDRPINIKKYELGALQIKNLLDEKIIELPNAVNLNSNEVSIQKNKILELVNHSYKAQDEFMHIIDEGEAGCLALSLLAKEKNIDNMIVIDERTTRMIVENPENLRRLFESKLHTKVQLKSNFSYIKDCKFMRSAEIVFIAYKKGLIKLASDKTLDALLYAVKFKGCAISEQEIQEIKKIG